MTWKSLPKGKQLPTLPSWEPARDLLSGVFRRYITIVSWWIFTQGSCQDPSGNSSTTIWTQQRVPSTQRPCDRNRRCPFVVKNTWHKKKTGSQQTWVNKAQINTSDRLGCGSEDMRWEKKESWHANNDTFKLSQGIRYKMRNEFYDQLLFEILGSTSKPCGIQGLSEHEATILLASFG